MVLAEREAVGGLGRGRQQAAGPPAEVTEVDPAGFGGIDKSLREVEGVVDERRRCRRVLPHFLEDDPLGS